MGFERSYRIKIPSKQFNKILESLPSRALLHCKINLTAMERLLNSGLNYEGPQVAKFLGH
jgi:hypothetical protein